MISYQRGFRLRSSSWNSVLCRAYSSASRWRLLPELSDGNVDTFRREAFGSTLPALLPRGHFLGLPAIRKWFVWSKHNDTRTSLDYTYLDSFSAAMVPLELTCLASGTSGATPQDSFQRVEVPFHVFLEWTKLATRDTSQRLYLAQASFAQLPQPLINDLPTPDFVIQAGTGDIYDTNLWLGIAPTYTPLHRDPNPNLFVQLAGHKIVRMLSPEAGDRVFSRVQRALGKSGSAAFRGDEMMKGKEKQLLEDEIWGDPSALNKEGGEAYEAHVWGGDGLFITKGWWHSIKGVDDGILGSVNWWFR